MAANYNHIALFDLIQVPGEVGLGLLNVDFCHHCLECNRIGPDIWSYLPTRNKAGEIDGVFSCAGSAGNGKKALSVSE
jgi:hypothetical protein